MKAALRRLILRRRACKQQKRLFQIIPADTTDPRYLEYIRNLLQEFSRTFLEETRYSYDDNIEADYKTKHRFFKKYAAFVLHRDVATIPGWTTPVTQAFSITQETANFLSEMVAAEDILVKYDSFWAVWECFYPAIKAMLGKSRSSHIDEIVSNYLLAWRWWKDTAKEWPSLRPKDAGFFKRACAEMGGHPIVLYSIAKFLNEVGSPFLDEGVLWIADMLSANGEFKIKELKPNTLYYLERAVRKYVYLNRTRLKANRLLRDKVLTVLDFLVSKGSVNGYLLREDIL